MSNTLLTKAFTSKERWEYALNKGINKDIRRRDVELLSNPNIRLAMYRAIKSDNYEIYPPHIALIPKDDGSMRTVLVNEPADRILLSIVNDILFEDNKDMISKHCKSYQKGISYARVVQHISRDVISKCTRNDIGFKVDLSKYFDSVKIEYIDNIFNELYKRYGENEPLLNVIYKYYHCDDAFDEHKNPISYYQSLKQGCSVASFFADVLLYHIDEAMNNLFKGYYVRYSDDILYIGDDYKEAYEYLANALNELELTLNPKKVEFLSKDRWFKFLGFSLKGDMISISKSRLKTFEETIKDLTIKSKNQNLKSCIVKVNNYLYRGNMEHSWGEQILPYINCERDIMEMNKFIMDCLKAVSSGKKSIGGLGYVYNRKNGVISRGKGSNVRTNRDKLNYIEGYVSLNRMKKAFLCSRALYDTILRTEAY